MPKIHIDKITHTLAGAAIAAALLPWGVIPALLSVIVVAVGKPMRPTNQGDLLKLKIKRKLSCKITFHQKY